MLGAQDIQNLQIIGYATVLKETMLPTVVPPIFQSLDGQGRVYLPPYSFQGNFLCNAAEVAHEEVVALSEAGEVTLFSAPKATMQDGELWIGPDFAPHYEPRADADKKLLAIAREHIALAEAALQEGRLADADRCAGIALSADDRLFEPLALKAAIRKTKGDPTGVRLMESIAERLVSAGMFEKVVDLYCRPAGRPANHQQKLRASGLSAMTGAASLR